MTSAPARDDLTPVLIELERARRESLLQWIPQGAWRAGLLATAVCAFAVWNLLTGHPRGLGDLLSSILGAVAGGYAWAGWSLNKAYRRHYKARVLPSLAADFGRLAWKPAKPDLAAFRRHRLFPKWDRCDAEDEIVGVYRGLALSVIEMTLTRDEGENDSAVFQGLIAQVTLPRTLKGLTLVVPDRGVFGNLADRLHGGPCEPVRLEDPDFARTYKVYGSDQVAARALLTPAFILRFLTLARSGRFGAPAALLTDETLLVALSTRRPGLFAAPSLLRSAQSRVALGELVADLRAVLSAVDAVIDLDHAARRQPLAAMTAD